jgi:hypothetical protein
MTDPIVGTAARPCRSLWSGPAPVANKFSKSEIRTSTYRTTLVPHANVYFPGKYNLSDAFTRKSYRAEEEPWSGPKAHTQGPSQRHSFRYQNERFQRANPFGRSERSSPNPIPLGRPARNGAPSGPDLRDDPESTRIKSAATDQNSAPDRPLSILAAELSRLPFGMAPVLHPDPVLLSAARAARDAYSPSARGPGPSERASSMPA